MILCYVTYNKEYIMNEYVDFHGYKVYQDGTIIGKYNTELHACNNGNGYSKVILRYNNKTHPHFIHRLVAKCFIPNPDNKPQVNHINGIKTDNRVENLEWCTNGENQLHAVKTGLKDNQLKLDWSTISYIRTLYDPRIKGRGYKALSKLFNVAYSSIRHIIKKDIRKAG